MLAGSRCAREYEYGSDETPSASALQPLSTPGVAGGPVGLVDWAATIAYALILFLKGFGLVGMLMLHTRVKFKINFRSEQQQQLFVDADRRSVVAPPSEDMSYAA